MGGEANKLKTNSTCRDLGGKHQEAEASNCTENPVTLYSTWGNVLVE